MTPGELKKYLAVLPPGSAQIVIKSADFELQLSVIPAGDAPERKGPTVYMDGAGNVIPPEVAETFPHLVKQTQ